MKRGRERIWAERRCLIRSCINLKAYFNETPPRALRGGEAEMGPMQVRKIYARGGGFFLELCFCVFLTILNTRHTSLFAVWSDADRLPSSSPLFSRSAIHYNNSKLLSLCFRRRWERAQRIQNLRETTTSSVGSNQQWLSKLWPLLESYVSEWGPRYTSRSGWPLSFFRQLLYQSSRVSFTQFYTVLNQSNMGDTTSNVTASQKKPLKGKNKESFQCEQAWKMTANLSSRDFSPVLDATDAPVPPIKFPGKHASKYHE